ncbi:MAG: 30S ribosomal protein S3 [Verrucomicrobiota bacterium]|nr:30S ribosomal protein S3 [Opitutales bacterium]UPA28706.1 MAG: 30S ribosomal protein S3 [Verrucomicrobiota bacterium]
MGQKVNPIGFRLSVRRNWRSRWYATKQAYPLFLKEDYEIRSFLRRRLPAASFSDVFIERAGERVRIKIYTSRPGVIIGRKGQDLDNLCAALKKTIGREVIVDIQEIRKPDLVAQLVSEGIALQLERRISFRRAMKKAIQSAMSLGADGIRIQCAGRLGGAEIARSESQRAGRVPLHTLKENIDYGFSEANTVYGKIGVKCWVCRNDSLKV